MLTPPHLRPLLPVPQWGKLWLHESERVYADRLVTVTDLEMYSKVRRWLQGPVKGLGLGRHSCMATLLHVT